MEMSQNMKRGLRSLKGNDTDQRLLGPHPQALACIPPVTTSPVLLLANLTPQHLMTSSTAWTGRAEASQTHGQLSFFGRNNWQNFQCPPPLNCGAHIIF
jgi:hypothetical protein